MAGFGSALRSKNELWSHLGAGLSVFPKKSKHEEGYQLRDTSDQWLVSKYTIAIIVSAPHLQ